MAEAGYTALRAARATEPRRNRVSLAVIPFGTRPVGLCAANDVAPRTPATQPSCVRAAGGGPSPQEALSGHLEMLAQINGLDALLGMPSDCGGIESAAVRRAFP